MTDRPLPGPPPRQAPSRHRRLSLLLSDLLLFDASRLDWLRAVRTVAALLLPLLLSRLLDMPLLAWAGVGAFLLAIGDSVDDGDRHQVPRLLLGTALGSLALACGVLASQSLPLALAAMFGCGLLAALLGAYGPAFAAMGLPVAWAYVEMGLPAGRSAAGSAAVLAGMFALGGAITLALTALQRLLLPDRALRGSCAACFRALAAYMDGPSRSGGRAPPIPSPETRVRAAIQEARRLAGETRPDRRGRVQRYAALIEAADRIFTAAAALHTGGRGGPDPLAGRLHALARAVARRGRALPRSSPATETGMPAGTVLRARLSAELETAERILGGAMPDIATPAPPPRAPRHLAGLLRPIRDCLHRDSLVGRHALRFATLVTIAVALYWVFPSPFGYWIPATVTVVLKPYAGITLSRTVQRCLGTGAGILAGTLLIPLLPGAEAQFAAVAAAFFCLMAVLPFNYSLAVFFLSLGLIPFEHLLMPALSQDVGMMRLAATGIGAALAVTGGHLLWPSFERNGLPALLRASLRSMAGYADAALRQAEGGGDPQALAAARRRAGLDTTNLQAGIQHAAAEPGGDPARLAAAETAAAALQRVANALNALAQTGAAPPGGTACLARFRPPFAATLEGLAAGGADAAIALPPASDREAAGAAHAAALADLAAELPVLRSTVPHCG